MKASIDGLVFAPNPQECPRCPTGGCDLTCVWDRDPQLWEGDQA